MRRLAARGHGTYVREEQSATLAATLAACVQPPTRVETRKHLVVVSGPEKIPVPAGEGVWVHPVGKKLHVHLGEQICETVLWS